MNELSRRLTLWAAKQPRTAGAQLALEAAEYLAALSNGLTGPVDDDTAADLGRDYLINAAATYDKTHSVLEKDWPTKVICAAVTDACKEILRLRELNAALQQKASA